MYKVLINGWLLFQGVGLPVTLLSRSGSNDIIYIYIFIYVFTNLNHHNHNLTKVLDFQDFLWQLTSLVFFQLPRQHLWLWKRSLWSLVRFLRSFWTLGKGASCPQPAAWVMWLIPLIFLHHLSCLSHCLQGVIHYCSVAGMAGCSSAIVGPSEEQRKGWDNLLIWRSITRRLR